MKKETEEKYEKLKKLIASYGSAAVAFSGGVDSTLLMRVTHDALKDKCIAITATSPAFPKRETKESEDFCISCGIRRITFDSDELSNPDYVKNPPDRCYICKKHIFTRMLSVAEENGCSVLIEGSNKDDEGDYRPGLIAIGELGIKSPLREVGLYKKEIREISEELGLKTFDKVSFACLASRFVYGEEITREKLAMVENGEEILRSLGLRQFRVRLHGNLARIEVEEADIKLLVKDETRAHIVKSFKQIGFDYITLDLVGYRTGSMNEVIIKNIPKK
ncbi:MAG: ATP-dependent sacrificial sulfur transferase LarE [Lachnospiraceae bacterium]|nr:ATP-dependent sacrificial sulfur transferase LarE [Lachnospiraceae bacterium]